MTTQSSYTLKQNIRRGRRTLKIAEWECRMQNEGIIKKKKKK